MTTGTGRLNRQIQIQAPTYSTDTEGRTSSPWTTVARPWAAIDNQAARETQQGGEELMTLAADFRIRWRASLTITPAMRVLFNGRIFLIVGITNPGEQNEWWVLNCEELRSVSG